MIAALYVMYPGVYYSIPGVEAYGAPVEYWGKPVRDAKLYDGPYPVVAHPPCGPWGRMRGLSKYQDKSCGPRAVEQVRKFGGVLEHPETSLLWAHCGLSAVGAGPDEYGGRTYIVQQVAWGHVCQKSTWLYVVGVPHELVLAGIKTGGAPTRVVTTYKRGPNRLPSASVYERTATPWEFAKWLISLANAVQPELLRK